MAATQETFLTFMLEKNHLNDVELNFGMGRILVIFQFLEYKKRYIKTSIHPLPVPPIL